MSIRRYCGKQYLPNPNFIWRRTVSRSVKSLNMMILNELASQGLPFITTPHSTLNEKFNAGLITPPSNQEYPLIKYLAIGRGGATSSTVGGSIDIEYLLHRTDDACLFDHLPFIVRTVNNDLNSTERAKYRLRKLITVGGIDYFAYYLKVIPNLPTTIETNVLTMVDGILSSSVAYDSKPSRLNPTPVDLTEVGLSLAEGKHLSVSFDINITLDASDVLNIINANEIIHNTSSLTIVSELAPVAGFDYTTTSNDGGHTVNYTEVRCAQVMAFLSTFRILEDQTNLPLKFKISEENPYPPTTGD